MTERQELLNELSSGTEVLLEALAGVTDERRKPAPEGWSILDCVEHVAIVEEYLLARLLEAVDAAAPVGSPERERKLRRFAPTRERRVLAPEMMTPRGRFATVAEALFAFRSNRENTIRYVEDAAGDLRAKTATHPILGPVNCLEMLLIMAAHPRRHAGQIAEVRRAIGG
jgi:hypothetical protein